jgi:hypothetical protein
MRIRLLLVLLFISGCASTAKFEAKMNGFLGQPESRVVSAYGPPQSIYTLADGSRVIQYSRGGSMVLPGATTMQPVTTNTAGNLTLNQGMRQTTGQYNQQSTTYVPQQAPSTTVQFSCTVNFTIGPDSVVREWSANGNRCVAD